VFWKTQRVWLRYPSSEQIGLESSGTRALTVLTENEIVQTLAEHLRREGYRIDKQLTTLEQGVDIVAIHLATGRRLLVEAKGGTSSKEGTARFGKPFPRIKPKVTSR